MSTIEVDKVIPQSGTALQVGEAGDTVNIVGTLQNNGAELTGDISSVVAGTGLAGGGTTGDVTLNIEAAQPTVTSTGTLAGFTSTGIDDNATSTAITIDSSENIGIGTTSPASLGSNITTLEITGGSTVRTGGLYLSSSDKNIKGYWYGSNTGYAFGTETASDLKFVTTNTERVRIHSDGVMSAVNGVALGVGTANTASNVLDDYEEGTWTPIYEGGTSNPTITYDGFTHGTYNKIGNMVFARGYIRTDATSGGSGGLLLAGFPFNFPAQAYGATILTTSTFGWSTQPAFTANDSNADTVNLYDASGNGLTTSNLTNSANSNVISFLAVYQV